MSYFITLGRRTASGGGSALNVRDDRGRSGLVCAICSSKMDVVRALVKAGKVGNRGGELSSVSVLARILREASRGADSCHRHASHFPQEVRRIFARPERERVLSIFFTDFDAHVVWYGSPGCIFHLRTEYYVQVAAVACCITEFFCNIFPAIVPLNLRTN